MTQHWDGLLTLRKDTLIWPDPLDLFRAGSKLSLNTIIHAVAVSEEASHPICQTINPTMELVEDILLGKRNAVLKRDWSSSGAHVYTKHAQGGTQKICQAFRRVLREETRAYDLVEATDHEDFHRPKWFIQPYLPALIYLGEIRAFFVNGYLMKKIITAPRNEDIQYSTVETPSMIKPLNILGYYFYPFFVSVHVLIGKIYSNLADMRNPNYTKRPGLAGSDLSVTLYDDKTSFDLFALRTLAKLIKAEEFITSQPSGLRVFVRLDISVFLKSGADKCQFVVNEVTRGHNVGFWSAWCTDVKMDTILQELSYTLHFLTYSFGYKGIDSL